MAQPRHILILTADAGFGHRAAANAIAEALKEHAASDNASSDAAEYRVIIENPLEDRRAPGFLRRAQVDYDRIIREAPDLYRFGYEASDGALRVTIAEQALIAMLYAALKDVVEKHQPDAIVTTYPLYQSPLAAIYALSRRYIPTFTVVTDLASVHSLWFNDDVDMCLVPTQGVHNKAIESGLSPERVEMTGLPVNPALARPVEQAALRNRLGWGTERFVGLLAGSKRVKKLEPVARALNHSGLPLELAIVTGGDDALRQRLQAEEWHLPGHVYGYVDDMASLMLAADFIICKAGGLIVSEALAAGLPLLLIEALPGQEAGNVEYVMQGGAGVMADTPLDALVTAFHWLDKGGAELKERAAHARALGKPQAAARVAELARQAALQGPIRREHRLALETPLLRKLLASRPAQPEL
jgi:1,2-diacylglycerol 3-beta-galactosyltransferase